MSSFFSTIQDKKVYLKEKDRLVWKRSKDGCFSVKSFYGVSEGLRVGSFPRKMIWNSCLPTKVSFFAWEVWWGKIFSTDQCKKRDRQLANRCPLCEDDKGNIDHLLLTVNRLENFGPSCLLFLESTGCFLAQLGRLYLVGKTILQEKSTRRNGWQPPCAFFGQLEGNE